MSPEPTTLAYLAGVIDSDGYISINRSCRGGRIYHGAQVGIAGTRRQPHDLAASIWGGKVHLYTPKDPHHRGQFQWSRQGASAIPVITAVLPYLLIKVEQARLALELHEHVEFGRGDDPFPWFGPDYDPVPHREEMTACMRAANQSRKRTGRTWDEFPQSAMAGAR